jgi:AraC-like DNA-binding protein
LNIQKNSTYFIKEYSLILMTETITIIGFVQALFGIALFTAKRPMHLSFVLLGIWLGVIAIFLGAMLLPFQVVDYFKPGIFPVLFVFGPILYFYVSSLTIERFRFKRLDVLHLLPWIIVSLHRTFTTPVAVSEANSFSIDSIPFYNQIYFILLIVSLFIYWFLSVGLILKHRQNIPYYFSNYSRKNTLTWLIFVVVVFLVFFVAIFFLSFVDAAEKYTLGVVSMPGNLAIFTFILVFFGTNQSVFYKSEKEDVPHTNTEAYKKYEHSGLKQAEIDVISHTVNKYLEEKKPYLNPDLSLQMMVDDLGISRQKLSQVINTGQKKNFYKLINEFRINEIKTLLVNPKYEHFTVLGIALECGFNSKTSFNRIFKEETGMTPTAYKNSL